MKFSMMSCVMSVRGCSVMEIVNACRELGIGAVDWVGTCGEKPEMLRRICHDAGLAICCHTFFLPRELEPSAESMDALMRGVDAAAVMQAPIAMLPTRPPSAALSRREILERWLPVVHTFAGLCRQRGIVPTVENFPGALSPLVTAEDFFAFKKDIPELKLTFDTGNAASGEDPVKSLERCYDDVVHVHFKDWIFSPVPREGFQRALDGRWMLPALIGAGEVDNSTCWHLLERRGYQGFCNLEYEARELPPLEAIRKSMEHLKH